MRERKTWIRYIPLLSGILCAYIILLQQEGKNVSIAEWVAIGVACIGVVGTLLATLLQLRRDGKTIDGINGATSSIHKEVSVTGKQVDIIQSGVSVMTESVGIIRDRTGKIDAIASEVTNFSRMRAEASASGVRSDVLLASMSAVFEENKNLQSQLREKNMQIWQLQKENNELKERVALLSKDKTPTRSWEMDEPSL